jgi:predicted house-cleaning noncanonical NTP pyrophosphatase (MazG superfamily)
MIRPKKLIRHKTIKFLQQNEFEVITNRDELNKLYALKIQEELLEIQRAGHKDIEEFCDLITVAVCFAQQNGFSLQQIMDVGNAKINNKGEFTDVALTNMNPSNKSNEIYFTAAALTAHVNED